MWKYFVAGIFSLCSYQLTNAAWLRCYNGSIKDYIVTPLDKPLLLTNSSCIDHALPTVVYTFGYCGRVQGPATTAVLSTYLATKKRNVILLDWEEEASCRLLGVPLGYALSAVPNAKTVGAKLGDSLVKLAMAGMNMNTTHLVAHSLGAHLMGYAGRRAREKGHVVARITGLDPARAFFEGSFAFQSGLDRTCAKFVDIIHSDPGGYGTSAPTGTVDIWPNYTGSSGSQPGCPVGDFEMLTPQDICSHDRAWKYFAEAIAAPTAFPAVAANDLESWMTRTSRSAETIYVGDLISTRARGNFYLSTGPSAPYGQGARGLRPGDTARARRHQPSALTRLLSYLR